MNSEEQFRNFPKPHIINLLCDMTDLRYDLEAKNGELERKLEIAVEALKKIAREYYGRPSTMMSEARQALAAIKGA